MLVAAFVIFGVAVLLGSAVAVLHLRGDGAAPPPLPLGSLHGLLAIIASAALRSRYVARQLEWRRAWLPLV